MKKILIFGGAGSLGTTLVKFYLDKKESVIVASRDEGKHWELRNSFPDDSIAKTNLKTHICDIRNEQRVKEVIYNAEPDVIILASALKQIDTCEYYPEESIETNVLGIRNVLRAINEVSRVKTIETLCFVSTDKACNPINVYGMCKSISEKLVINNALQNKDVKHVVVRYGNVVSSKGSIIPLLEKQAKNPEQTHFTLTHEDMTRFMMTLHESVKLIDDAITHVVSSGELWIPKLDSMKIVDLMKYFSEKSGKSTKITGLRPGEKIHEVLFSVEESLYAQYIPELNYYKINKNGFNVNKNSIEEFSSKDHCISYEELKRRIDLFLKTGDYDKQSSNMGT